MLQPENEQEAAEALIEADAAFGTLPRNLLPYAKVLRWLQAPQAGPPKGFYYQELIEHPVVVTNLRGTYTENVATHAVSLVLSLARRLHRYSAHQAKREWIPEPDPDGVVHFPESTVLVVGAGAIGSEVARLLAAFRARVIATDARRTERPEGVAELHPAEALDGLLPAADVVVLTVPHTPQTEGLMRAERLASMKPGGYLVNVGRGALVRLDDLVAALRAGTLAGAALDVFEEEPLPLHHPLWSMENVIITPHVADTGPYNDERRLAVLIENARRFADGQPLLNVVDKANWF